MPRSRPTCVISGMRGCGRLVLVLVLSSDGQALDRPPGAPRTSSDAPFRHFPECFRNSAVRSLTFTFSMSRDALSSSCAFFIPEENDTDLEL